MSLYADQIARAADLLIEAGRSGQMLAALPEDLRPANVDEAHAIQDVARRVLGHDIGAIKVNVSGELVYRGMLSDAVCQPSPAVFDTAPGQFAGIEAEIAFRFPDGLAPSSEPYERDAVAAAAEACAAFDLVGTRFRDFMKRTAFERIADGLNAGAFAYGRATRDWRSVNFAAMPVQVAVNGVETFAGTGGHAAGDPFNLVMAYVNSVRGEGLKPGAILTTGSFCGLLPVAPGQTIIARLGDFDPVEVTLRASR